ncbi:MAG: B-box zinc finger protein [Anaerolineae bacterium]|nr:B-box zinc finger protein [Anaerolineae bacterium]
MASQAEITTTTDEELHYCTVHPDREATLRCNRCERYMCVQCAVQTPVGYRCRECVRTQEDKYFNASDRDLLLIGGICLVLGGIAGSIIGQIGLWLLFVLILSAPVGGGIAEVALRAVKRRRGRYMAQVAAGATAVGALFPILWILLQAGVFVPRLDVLLFAGIAAVAVYGRMAMRG